MNLETAKSVATDYARRDQSRWYVFEQGGTHVLASQLDRESFFSKMTPAFTADPIWSQPTAAAPVKKRLPPLARIHHLNRFYAGSRS